MARTSRHLPAAGFGASLEPGTRPALLFVDFVNAYFVPGSPLYAGVEQVREPAKVLLAAARRARIPIVHTDLAYEPGGAMEDCCSGRFPVCAASSAVLTPSSRRSPTDSSRFPARR